MAKVRYSCSTFTHCNHFPPAHYYGIVIFVVVTVDGADITTDGAVTADTDVAVAVGTADGIVMFGATVDGVDITTDDEVTANTDHCKMF